MDKFKKLVLAHADAMAEMRRLKAAGTAALAQCPRAKADTRPRGDEWGQNCIEAAYAEMPKVNAENPDYFSFEEVFLNMEPEACEHCIEVRRLKKERGAVGRRLGAIRAAMAVAAKAERAAS